MFEKNIKKNIKNKNRQIIVEFEKMNFIANVDNNDDENNNIDIDQKLINIDQSTFDISIIYNSLFANQQIIFRENIDFIFQQTKFICIMISNIVDQIFQNHLIVFIQNRIFDFSTFAIFAIFAIFDFDDDNFSNSFVITSQFYYTSSIKFLLIE